MHLRAFTSYGFGLENHKDQPDTPSGAMYSKYLPSTIHIFEIDTTPKQVKRNSILLGTSQGYKQGYIHAA